MIVAYRGHEHTIALRSDLTINATIPWCIDVDGAWYQLGRGDDASGFFRHSLRNAPRRTPPFVASKRYPMLAIVDGIAVRAWPQFVARGTESKTYMHPTLGRRVGTERGPVWLFEATNRSPSECGTVTAEQSLDDVIDLAKIWLRSHP